MRAALYNGKKSIEMTELPTPEAGENDIVVKNIYASICGTDVAVYEHGPGTGHRITVGSEFGHEMVSEVFQVGKNVKNIKVGDRVYPYPRLAKGDPKRAGTTGIAAAIALKYFGCHKVMICDHSDFRLNKAKELGFEICNNGKEELKAKSKQVFGCAMSALGETCDVDIYIDAAGADGIIENYQSMGKINSRMVVVAVKAGLRPIDVLAMTYGQHAIIGSGGYFPEDVWDVMAIMKSRKWDIESIITDVYPWEQLPQAIEKASRVDEALNVVIQY
ncbi:zinc-binding dehydrogenase [Ruminococcus sp.]|uniref:zinc-binding dehydrogenase n=1 Tax=Ruminococcus sp. TaxID=41978 RepID=UPI00352755E8